MIYWQTDHVILHHGDSAHVLTEIASDSIDLTVTSPPYDNLRTYQGYVFDFATIARELYRVTKPGGVVVWVVGDATVNGSETGTSFRQALYFKDVCGFNLHDTMIYQKDALQFPDANRYGQIFEYMFIFSKGATKSYHPIADRKNISYGRKVTGTNRSQNGETKKASCWGQDIKQFGDRFNIWLISNVKGNSQLDHPAQFPEALARDHILSWSNPGDTVLDPFLGSGTTLKMANLLDRTGVGIEISEDYLTIAKRRIARAQQQTRLAF